MAKKGKLSKNFETVNEVIRPERVRKYKYLFLIVCEDERTEKEYFNQFKSQIPAETIFLEAIGTGFDQLGIVEQAIKERDKLYQLCKREVDTVWVVFDKDDADKYPNKTARFEKAINIATENNFQLGFSNEVFELWLLLHLCNVDPDVPLPRQTIYDQLQEQVRLVPGNEEFVYKHGNIEILQKIQSVGDEQKAMERAYALLEKQKNKVLLQSNPVTHIVRLVSELLASIRYYSYQG